MNNMTKQITLINIHHSVNLLRWSTLNLEPYLEFATEIFRNTNLRRMYYLRRRNTVYREAVWCLDQTRLQVNPNCKHMVS